jgi:hypothetical protein
MVCFSFANCFCGVGARRPRASSVSIAKATKYFESPGGAEVEEAATRETTAASVDEHLLSLDGPYPEVVTKRGDSDSDTSSVHPGDIDGWSNCADVADEFTCDGASLPRVGEVALGKDDFDAREHAAATTYGSDESDEEYDDNKAVILQRWSLVAGAVLEVIAMEAAGSDQEFESPCSTPNYMETPPSYQVTDFYASSQNSSFVGIPEGDATHFCIGTPGSSFFGGNYEERDFYADSRTSSFIGAQQEKDFYADSRESSFVGLQDGVDHFRIGTPTGSQSYRSECGDTMWGSTVWDGTKFEHARQSFVSTISNHTVTIVGTEKVGSARTTYFKIEVQGVTPRLVLKRFRQFEELDRALRKRLPPNSLPLLPPKSLLLRKNFSPKFKEARVKALGEYLSAAVAADPTLSIAALRQFLGMPTMLEGVDENVSFGSSTGFKSIGSTSTPRSNESSRSKGIFGFFGN